MRIHRYVRAAGLGCGCLVLVLLGLVAVVFLILQRVPKNYPAAALDAQGLRGSPEFRRRGQPYSICPALAMISLTQTQTDNRRQGS